jgi:hypothetical protein
VRYRLGDGDIGAEHVAQDIFRISRRPDAEHIDARAAVFNLIAQAADDVHRVFDGIAQ